MEVTQMLVKIREKVEFAIEMLILALFCLMVIVI